MAGRRISVRLDMETEAKLQLICQRTGMSQTAAIKAGIALVAERPPVKRPAELAREMGLIGAFESGVNDLGKNHSRYIKEKLARQHRSRS
jgi:hypothetical protein